MTTDRGAEIVEELENALFQLLRDQGLVGISDEMDATVYAFLRDSLSTALAHGKVLGMEVAAGMRATTDSSLRLDIRFRASALRKELGE